MATMKRILILLASLFLVRESFALPPCPSTKYLADRHNCYGTYTLINGSIYVGEFGNIFPNGQGTFTDANGDKYVGGWRNGKMHGQGTYRFASGNKYVGEYKDDKRHGQGTYTWVSGHRYVGEWQDDKMHGQGTFTWTNGDKYVGEFKDDKPNGQGTKTYANGGKYVGGWRNDKRHGQGTLTRLSGRKYVGEYKDDKMHGQGTYTSYNGNKYVGEYKDGLRHGLGTFTSADGNKYVGGYKNGIPWEGVQYLASGEIWGTYSNGKSCADCKPTAGQLAIVREIKTNLKLIATGTGFVINKYYVVTAEHVLENCNAITVRHGHQEIDAQTAARDASNDLGLIRLQKSIGNTAKLRGGKRIRLGEMVANYGYPLFGQLSTSATITEGNINNLSGPGNDSTVLQFDAPTQPGNSGGPLLDSSGNVVGVAIKGLSKKYADATGHIAQNVNFAVKSNIVENFLQSNNIPFQTAASTAKLELPDIAEKAETFTVLVGCWE
jgi:V8-like Glu-specific endopeptidase